MLARILGIVLIVVGADVALGVLFPLIGSVFGLLFLILKLAVALAMVYAGTRLLARD